MNIKTILLTTFGLIFVVLGTIGLVLPVWPTTPFLLAASACFTGVPKLKEKLMTIPVFKDHLINYQKRVGLSKKTVLINLVFLWVMLLISAFFVESPWLLLLFGIIGTAVTAHIVYMAKPKNPSKIRANISQSHKVMCYIEPVFNIIYLGTVLFLGVYALHSLPLPYRVLVASMAFILASGDGCHLVPRILSILSGDRQRFIKALGLGKMIASLSMTTFYILLWHMGLQIFSLHIALGWTALVYSLGAIRIILTVLPQNKWSIDASPMSWSVVRNIPFAILGGMVGFLFFVFRNSGMESLQWMWLAILLSFAFYLPVIIGAKKYPPLGMLMLPKSCAYVWIITMLI